MRHSKNFTFCYRLLLLTVFLSLLSPVKFAYGAVYKVQKNDTLWGLAKRNEIDPDTLAVINHLNNKPIIPGQSIIIPDKIINYTVKKGDNLSRIASNLKSNIEIITSLNRLTTTVVFEGQTIKVPVLSDYQPMEKKNSSSVYIVQKGDNLTRIATRFNTPASEILKLNHKKNDSVFIGEKLMIRQKSSHQTVPQTQTYLRLDPNYLFPVEKSAVRNVRQTSRGLSIYLNNKATVRSINNGFVEYAGQMKGYDNVIIVRYGPANRAIFGYLNDILVSSETVVKSGEPIGTVSYHAFLGKTCLYFELRKGTDTTDPLTLFPFLKQDFQDLKKD